jgi:hypothetical protein
MQRLIWQSIDIVFWSGVAVLDPKFAQESESGLRSMVGDAKAKDSPGGKNGAPPAPFFRLYGAPISRAFSHWRYLTVRRRPGVTQQSPTTYEHLAPLRTDARRCTPSPRRAPRAHAESGLGPSPPHRRRCHRPPRPAASPGGVRVPTLHTDAATAVDAPPCAMRLRALRRRRGCRGVMVAGVLRWRQRPDVGRGGCASWVTARSSHGRPDTGGAPGDAEVSATW